MSKRKTLNSQPETLLYFTFSLALLYFTILYFTFSLALLYLPTCFTLLYLPTCFTLLYLLTCFTLPSHLLYFTLPSHLLCFTLLSHLLCFTLPSHFIEGMRIIISEKKNPIPSTADKDEDSVSNLDKIRNAEISPSSSSSSSSPSSPSSSDGKANEEAAVWRVYSIVCSSLSAGSRSSSEWMEDKTRFKDYVTKPKPSGYVST